MRARLQEFSLSLHPDKTRLIAFGRRVAAERARRGLGKPETFNFLGCQPAWNIGFFEVLCAEAGVERSVIRIGTVYCGDVFSVRAAPYGCGSKQTRFLD
jgi:hypothetical protein